MKKVLLFVLLKVLEIVIGGSLLTGVYLALCKFGYWLDGVRSEQDLEVWYCFDSFMLGFSFTVAIAIALLVLYGIFFHAIPSWFRLNKKWVDKLID